MFAWLKNLLTRPDPETLEAQNQRKKQRRASQKHSRRVRARERELRRQAQGSRRRAPFYLGKGAGMPPPLGAWGACGRVRKERGFTRTLMIFGWLELWYRVKWALIIATVNKASRVCNDSKTVYEIISICGSWFMILDDQLNMRLHKRLRDAWSSCFRHLHGLEYSVKFERENKKKHWVVPWNDNKQWQQYLYTTNPIPTSDFVIELAPMV